MWTLHDIFQQNHFIVLTFCWLTLLNEDSSIVTQAKFEKDAASVDQSYFAENEQQPLQDKKRALDTESF